MKQIEIFRAGRHTDTRGVAHQFTPADLQAIAAGYAPARHEAPLVVGHPHTDAPAWGWVKALRAVGDRLIAIPDQVQAAFAEAVQSGAYKKVSAAFYAPGDAHNPTPGQWHLRHVGFLGAQPPAVKGLAGPAFAEGDTPERDGVIAFAEPAPEPESAPPASPTPQPKESNVNETPEDLAALRAQNESLQRELDALRQQQARAAQAARSAEHTAFAEALVTKASVPAAHAATLVAVLDAINPPGAPVMFGEGDAATPLHAQLREFLQALPPMTAFGEQATRGRAAEAEAPAVTYAEGADPERIALDQRIRAHMQTHQVGYAAAYAAVAAQAG